jgi:cobalt-zinc-cadmium efflux system membrane fusion protein
MTNYKFILPIIISAILFTVSSCKKGEKQKNQDKKAEIIPENMVELRDDQIKLANIETGAIETHALSGILKVNGRVISSPLNLAMVSMPMGGIIKSTSLIPGNFVKKGQTLAVIENYEFVDIQQNYLEAKNKLEYATADYKRQNELYKNEVSSKKNMQLVTSDFKNLKVQVKALAQKLSLIGINPFRLNENNISRSVALVSPISGYVKSINASIGKSVSESDVLFEIVNNSNLFIELTLFEKDINKVSTGQNIRFFVNNETEQHKAVIYQTAKSIDTDKAYKVYAKVKGTCKNILPGMYVNALIEVASNKVTALPSEAIVGFEDKDYIFVFDHNEIESGKSFTRYRMVQVHKGVTNDGFTEIILPDNFNYKTVKVVVKGAYNLLSAKKNAGEMSC